MDRLIPPAAKNCPNQGLAVSSIFVTPFNNGILTKRLCPPQRRKGTFSVRTSCRELDRRSVADYQMTEGKQRDPRPGRRELEIVLAVLILLALVVGTIIVMGIP